MGSHRRDPMHAACVTSWSSHTESINDTTYVNKRKRHLHAAFTSCLMAVVGAASSKILLITDASLVLRKSLTTWNPAMSQALRKKVAWEVIGRHDARSAATPRQTYHFRKISRYSESLQQPLLKIRRGTFSTHDHRRFLLALPSIHF